MIAPAFLVGLHAYRRLVGLDVSASEQFTLHCRSDWYEQLAGIDHRIIECRQRQLDAGVAAHRGLLTIDRFRVTVFANDQIDDHVAGENRLGQNALRRRSCLNALHFALPAGPLLALDHAHGVFGRANVEHLRLFVADDAGLLAALAADALLGCAADRLVDALEMAGQFVAARMLAPRLALRLILGFVFIRRGQRFAFAFGLNLFARYARSQIEQLQLQAA
jgi:hypothetical protein